MRVTKESNWYVLFLAPAEGLCEGIVTVSHSNYNEASSKAAQFRSAAANGMCNGYKVQRDFHLERISEGLAKPNNGL